MAGVISNLCYSAGDVKDLVSAYRRGGNRGIQSAIESKYKQFGNVHLRIAVMGESGVGKSTLVNALLGLDEDGEGAAKTGVTETTTEITPYAHPSLPNVHYYDFPGLNTPNFPMKRFLKETKFAEYDFGIIVISDRFTENNQSLVTALQKAGKQVYMVRSKIDQAVNPMGKKKGFNQEELLQKVREYCSSFLVKAGIQNPRVFLCSAYDLDKFEFPELRKAVVSNLSETQKNLFLVALPNTSEASIDSKRDSLRSYIQIVAVVSGAVGAVPVPGLSLACDLGLITSGILFMRQNLGLDDRSLNNLARRVGTSKEELRRGTQHNWVFGEITPAQVVLLIQRSTVAITLTALEPILDFVPILGSIFGATTSFGVTLMMLNDSLDVMVETAKRVLGNAKAAASVPGAKGTDY